MAKAAPVSASSSTSTLGPSPRSFLAKQALEHFNPGCPQGPGLGPLRRGTQKDARGVGGTGEEVMEKGTGYFSKSGLPPFQCPICKISLLGRSSEDFLDFRVKQSEGLSTHDLDALQSPVRGSPKHKPGRSNNSD